MQRDEEAPAGGWPAGCRRVCPALGPSGGRSALRPSPALPPRSATLAGLPSLTARPAGPRHAASVYLRLPPPRPPPHPSARKPTPNAAPGLPRRPAVAPRSREADAVAAASRFRPPPQGSARSPLNQSATGLGGRLRPLLPALSPFRSDVQAEIIQPREYRPRPLGLKTASAFPKERGGGTTARVSITRARVTGWRAVHQAQPDCGCSTRSTL